MKGFIGKETEASVDDSSLDRSVAVDERFLPNPVVIHIAWHM